MRSSTGVRTIVFLSQLSLLRNVHTNAQVGDKLLLMPNRTPVKVTNVFRDEEEVQAAKAGENLRLR
jgi:translation elongation factor EF-1alpha